MRYQANPVVVEAHRIVSVGPITTTEVFHAGGETPAYTEAAGSRHLALENGWNVTASPEMLARMTPEVGDYWVIQEDGYVYLNPATVFLRKYSRVLPDGADTIIHPDGSVEGVPLPDLRGIRG